MQQPGVFGPPNIVLCRDKPTDKPTVRALKARAPTDSQFAKLVCYLHLAFLGRVAEWSKARAWRARRRLFVSWVRIPPCPYRNRTPHGISYAGFFFCAAFVLRRKQRGPSHPAALPGVSDARRANAERSERWVRGGMSRTAFLTTEPASPFEATSHPASPNDTPSKRRQSPNG